MLPRPDREAFVMVIIGGFSLDPAGFVGVIWDYGLGACSCHLEASEDLVPLYKPPNCLNDLDTKSEEQCRNGTQIVCATVTTDQFGQFGTSCICCCPYLKHETNIQVN